MPGEGIQRIAVGTEDIHGSTDAIAEAGISFKPLPPHVHCEGSHDRVRGHEESVERMKRHGILIDGDGVVGGGQTRILPQISSRTVIGPIFLEFMHRKGDDGRGEGNFKALFESIEEDRIRRGVPKIATGRGPPAGGGGAQPVRSCARLDSTGQASGCRPRASRAPSPIAARIRSR